MALLQPNYDGGNNSITITMATLNAGLIRQSLAINNETADALDIKVGGSFTVASPAAVGDQIHIYCAGSADSGTTYDGEATGTDLAYTGTTSTLRKIQTLTLAAAGPTTVEVGAASVAAAFNGWIPARVAFIVHNDTAGDFTAASLHYQVIKGETV